MKTKIEKIAPEQFDIIVQNSGLQIVEGEEIKKNYQPFLVQLAEIQENASKINFETPAEIDETIARELRLKTVKIRTGSADLKDSRKKVHLLKGNLEQAAYNLIAASCKLTEEAFFNVEKSREIAESKRKEIRKTERIELLTPYGVDTNFYDLLNMPDEIFSDLLETSRISFENKKAAEAKLEAEKIAREKAEEEERERIRIENERLKADAIKKEKQVELERKKHEEIIAKEKAKADAVKKLADEKLKEEKAKSDKLAAELKAKADAIKKLADEKLKEEKAKSDKLAAELKAKADAEEKRLSEIEAEKKARIAAEKKAKHAPDKQKLLSLCDKIESFEMPVVSCDEAKEIIKKTKDLFSKVVSFIKTKAEEI